MKIMILGGWDSASRMAAALAISLSVKQSEIVTIDSLSDIELNDGDVLICDDEHELSTDKGIVYCGHPLLNIGINHFPESIVTGLERDNTFRGGSRGKGGKIKYRRG